MSREYSNDPDHGGDAMDMSEESLRQALARLGGGGRQSRPSPSNSSSGAQPARGSTSTSSQEPHGNSRNRPSYSGTLHTSGHASGGDSRSDGRRRRFVQDGQVVVEHQNQRPSSRGSAAAQEDHDEIERLKQSVRREQRRCEEETRALSDARNTIRGLETRVAHTSLHVQELEGQMRQRDERIAELTLLLREAQTVPEPVAPPVMAPVTLRPAVAAELPDVVLPAIDQALPRRAPRVNQRVKATDAASASAEPEPVKWWIRG